MDMVSLLSHLSHMNLPKCFESILYTHIRNVYFSDTLCSFPLVNDSGLKGIIIPGYLLSIHHVKEMEPQRSEVLSPSEMLNAQQGKKFHCLPTVFSGLVLATPFEYSQLFQMTLSDSFLIFFWQLRKHLFNSNFRNGQQSSSKFRGEMSGFSLKGKQNGVKPLHNCRFGAN